MGELLGDAAIRIAGLGHTRGWLWKRLTAAAFLSSTFCTTTRGYTAAPSTVP